MLLKRFYINLIVRLVLILITMGFQSYILRDLIDGQLLFTFMVLTLILILQVVLMFLYVKKTNRLLTRLILSVSNQDFSQSLGTEKSPHTDLKLALNSIIEQYQSVYMEKESQSFLLHHLVQAIPAGISVMNEEGRVLISNKAFTVLLGLKGADTIEEIKAQQAEFYRKFLEPGNSGSYTFEITLSGERKKLAVSVTRFPLLNRAHMILLVQDISREIDAGEIDAIQRLLRILTHEIMNSLTPVHSLTETITMLMTNNKGQPKQQEQLSQKNYDDILESVQAIQERTGNLDHFVNKFRTLTRKPESLEKKAILVRKLLEKVNKIMHMQLKGVKLVLDVNPGDLQITADSALMEQVMINLITNSLTAMSGTEHPLLTLKAFRQNGYVLIQVQDNGEGIPEEKLDDIFMPFYSTKEQASGIGLSFVKQILRLHNASIRVQSTLKQGSIFSISFNETAGS